MFKEIKARAGLLATVAGVAAVTAGVAGCSMDEILRVDAPDVLTTDELKGPGEVSTLINGIYGAFNEQFDDYVRYSGLLTDEFILAGTFPTRLQVDERNIVDDNATVTAEVAEAMHRARLMADTAVVNFTQALEDEAFADVVDQLGEGIAIGKFYGGYLRMLLGELYCETPVANGPVMSSDQLAEAALESFQDAEAGADSLGLADVVAAARVGQARALMWLGRYGEAAIVAADVTDSGFEYLAEFSGNTPDQRNEVYMLTWGTGGNVIRWTVGDGGEDARGNERWPYYDEWVALGLVIPAANEARLTADPFSGAVGLTNAQTKYDGFDADIVIASKVGADLIRAEVAVRNNDFPTANTIVNDYRAAWGLGPIDFADAPALEASFEVPLPPSADTDLKVRLAAMAREGARELWLTGERQATLRRYYENDGLDLYPVRGGTDVCYPIPRQETDNNPNF